MENLITATGKEIKCDYFNPFVPLGHLYIRVLGLPLVEVAQIFGNPAETVQLWWGNEYVANHTQIVNIMPEDDAIRVTLGKE